MKKRVADIIMEILAENHITTCFAVVGGGAMHLDNALALSKDIKTYFNHHEQACAIAAEAYARYSGQMAAVCVTSGPGATNAVTGVMGAWVDSLPMLVLSGQMRYETTVQASGLPLRYRGMQEFDIIHSVSNMTKYCCLVRDPLEIRAVLQKAITIAMEGRRGPVWVDVPLDVQGAVVEEKDLYPVTYKPQKPLLDMQDIEKTARLLQEAKRPVILAGNGIVNSGNLALFRKFVDRMGIPVVAAAFAADVMFYDHDNYYGLSGIIGPRAGNFIVQNADVILSIGCTLGFKMTGFAQERFAPNAKILMVDVDESEAKKPGLHITRLIHADMGDFLNEMMNLSSVIDVDEEWIQYCRGLKERFSPFEPGENLAADERVCAYYFWKQFENLEPEDSIVALGNNTANSAKLQIGIKKRHQRVLSNHNSGSMGVDLPEAIGAAIAAKKPVVCLTGDGSIMMNLQELQTIQHYRLPVKIVVFSNDGYNAIRQTSKNYFNGLFFGCNAESGVSFPPFNKVAECFGYEYRHCHNNKEVRDCLRWLFAQKDNALLEVAQRLDDPVTPKLMSRMNDDGTFSSPALEDMAPFLPEDELAKYMISNSK